MRGGRNNLPERVKYALFETNWKIRRRVMFATLIYIAVNLEWILIMGADTALNAQVALALVGAGVSIIAAYVFGAVWDDNHKRGCLMGPDIDVDVDISRQSAAPPVEGGLS